MADDTAKPEPIPFDVQVTVNNVQVTVTLLLRPGTTVSVANEQKKNQPSDGR
jgi:hypothetical protein